MIPCLNPDLKNVVLVIIITILIFKIELKFISRFFYLMFQKKNKN